jgi:hypothetical protein
MKATQRAKPVSEATRALLDEMRADAAPSEDKLDKVRDMISRLRDTEMVVETLQQRVSEHKQTIKEIKEKTLVDLFDDAGIDRLGLPAQGNLPPYEVQLGEYYHANIPDERQRDAYAYLTKTKNEDLIKTTFTVAFGLRDAKSAAKFEALLKKSKVTYDKKQGVPWNTLTSWFRVEHRRKPLPVKVMEILGASVGRVAKVVKQKEKK